MRKKVGIKGVPSSPESLEKQRDLADALELRKRPNPGPFGMFRGGAGNLPKSSVLKPPTWQEFLQNMSGEFKGLLRKGLESQTPAQQKETWEKMKFQVEYGVGDGESEELKWHKNKYEQDLMRQAPPYFNTPGGYEPLPKVKRFLTPSKRVRLSQNFA